MGGDLEFFLGLLVGCRRPEETGSGRLTRAIARAVCPTSFPAMGRISPSKRAGRDSAIVKRAVRVAGQNTSVSLENAFWVALGEIVATQGIRRTALISTIESERRGNLSSAIRLFVLDYYRNLCRVKD